MDVASYEADKNYIGGNTLQLGSGKNAARNSWKNWCFSIVDKRCLYWLRCYCLYVVWMLDSYV